MDKETLLQEHGERREIVTISDDEFSGMRLNGSKPEFGTPVAILRRGLHTITIRALKKGGLPSEVSFVPEINRENVVNARFDLFNERGSYIAYIIGAMQDDNGLRTFYVGGSYNKTVPIPPDPRDYYMARQRDLYEKDRRDYEERQRNLPHEKGIVGEAYVELIRKGVIDKLISTAPNTGELSDYAKRTYKYLQDNQEQLGIEVTRDKEERFVVTRRSN